MRVGGAGVAIGGGLDDLLNIALTLTLESNLRGSEFKYRGSRHPLCNFTEGCCIV